MPDLSVMVGSDGHEHGTGGSASCPAPAGRPDNRLAGSRLWSRPGHAGALSRCQGTLQCHGVPFPIQRAKGLAPHHPRISTEVACAPHNLVNFSLFLETFHFALIKLQVQRRGKRCCVSKMVKRRFWVTTSSASATCLLGRNT